MNDVIFIIRMDRNEIILKTSFLENPSTDLFDFEVFCSIPNVVALVSI